VVVILSFVVEFLTENVDKNFSGAFRVPAG